MVIVPAIRYSNSDGVNCEAHLNWIAALALLIPCMAAADPPCDFKGITVGDKMTAQEVMDHLGVKQWHDYTQGEPAKSEAEGDAY